VLPPHLARCCSSLPVKGGWRWEGRGGRRARRGGGGGREEGRQQQQRQRSEGRERGRGGGGGVGRRKAGERRGFIFIGFEGGAAAGRWAGFGPALAFFSNSPTVKNFPKLPEMQLIS
jgi:hypothetical protein